MTSAQAQATIGLFSSVGTHLSPFRPKVPTPVPMLRLDHPHPTGARSGFGGAGPNNFRGGGLEGKDLEPERLSARLEQGKHASGSSNGEWCHGQWTIKLNMYKPKMLELELCFRF